MLGILGRRKGSRKNGRKLTTTNYTRNLYHPSPGHLGRNYTARVYHYIGLAGRIIYGSRTQDKSKYIIFTFLSFATFSTSDRVITTASFSVTSLNRRMSIPHSFSAKAASSARRFVARAISASLHLTWMWVSAPPSSRGVVSKMRSVVNIGSE